MTFIEFAMSHGVIIDRLYPRAGIQRCGTVAHPRSTNGAFFFDGRDGWVQNWETMDAPVWWRDIDMGDVKRRPSRPNQARLAELARRERMRHAEAARQANEMIASARMDRHDYLKRKGFPDARGLVGLHGELIVPMRAHGSYAVVGAQTIQWDGESWSKLYLPGTRAKGAVFFVGRRSAPELWLVEGYATGLSVAEALRSLSLNAAVVVTFAAGNLRHVAGLLDGRCGYVFADHDASGAGQQAAEATGLPWVMSQRVGEDANDLMIREGIASVAELIVRCRRDRRRAA